MPSNPGFLNRGSIILRRNLKQHFFVEDEGIAVLSKIIYIDSIHREIVEAIGDDSM